MKLHKYGKGFFMMSNQETTLKSANTLKKPQNDGTLQKFIDKHIVVVENVQRDLKKKRKWKIYKTSSYFNLNVKIYPCQKLTDCSNGCILSYQKSTTCNKLNVEMGGVF